MRMDERVRIISLEVPFIPMHITPVAAMRRHWS